MKRDRWLLAVSIAIFVGLGVFYLRPGWVAMLRNRKSLTVAPRPAPAAAIPQGSASPGLPQVSSQSEPVGEQTPWGRNPFLTGEEEAARGTEGGGEELHVKAIIVGPPKSVATIDGRSVTVGEKIGEETVLEIRPDAVVLERDGHKRLLKVREPAVSVEVEERKK